MVEIKSSTTTLDTQIRDVGSGSLSDVVSLEILTFESNQQIEVDSVDLTLTEENGSTNLLTTALEASFKLVDKTKLKFKPGIWAKGKTYVLTAIAHKGTLAGKAVKIIKSEDVDLFEAKVTPRIVSTGDVVKATIRNKSPSQCLYCSIGFYIDSEFEPFSVLSNPARL